MFSFQFGGEGNKFDVPLEIAKVAGNFGSDIVEAASNTSANIVNTADLGVIQEPTVQTGDVVNVDKIAPLLSRFDSSVLPKELNGFKRLALFVELVDHTRCCPTTLFSGSIDVEQAEPRDLRGANVGVLDDVLIKQHL